MAMITAQTIRSSRALVSGAALLFSASLSIFGCQSESTPTDSAFDCDTEYSEDCSHSCVVNADCPVGLHCRSGSCFAECSDSSHCTEGECSDDGRCLRETNPGEVTIDVPPPIEMEEPEEKEPEICAETQAEFEVRIPQVWLILDRSGSMDENLSGGSRWAALGDVLFGVPGDDDDLGVVGAHESQVSFGATYFDGYFSSSASGCVTNLDSTAVSLSNYDALKSQYDGLSPGSSTPTADAVNEVATIAANAPATSGPKILILATDGEPSCGNTETEVESAVANAFNDHRLVTFAVFLGPPSMSIENHLQRVANVGVGRPEDAVDPAEFYTAEDPDKLREAFDKIIGSTRGCVFELNGTVDESAASKGSVTLNGEQLVFEDPDGWQLKSESEVELLGLACEGIKDGATMLDIEFPCDVFTPTVVR